MAVTHVPVSVGDVAAYTVDADNAGIRHYIGDLTADCTITLPSPVAGIWFEFARSAVAIDAQDWIIDSGSDTNYFDGGVLHVDDAPAANSIIPDGNSNSKFTVLTPEAGTLVRVESLDGTVWTLSGVVVSASAPTFADQ